MIIASNNKNKILQLKEILPSYNLKSLSECGINVEVEETGKTFEENSTIKAKAIFDLTHDSVIADDSGLCILEYNNWPGVETHRFLGENSTHIERNDFILNKMKNLDYNKRKCVSVCVITLIDKKGNVYSFKGELYGHIAKESKGNNSFGYDDIFELDNGVVMAELTNEEKYKFSARAKALELLQNFIALHKEIEL